MRVIYLWLGFLEVACAATPHGQGQSATPGGSAETDASALLRVQVFIEERADNDESKQVSTPCSPETQRIRFVPLRKLKLSGGITGKAPTGYSLSACRSRDCRIELFSVNRLIAAVRVGGSQRLAWKALRDAWEEGTVPSASELLESGLRLVVDNRALVAATALFLSSVFAPSEVSELERQAAMTLLGVWLSEQEAAGDEEPALKGLVEWVRWFEAAAQGEQRAFTPSLRLPKLSPPMKKILLAALADQRVAKRISKPLSWGGLTEGERGLALSAVVTLGPRRFFFHETSQADSDIGLFLYPILGHEWRVSYKDVDVIAGAADVPEPNIGRAIGPSFFFLPRSSSEGLYIHSTPQVPQGGDEAVPIVPDADAEPLPELPVLCNEIDPERTAVFSNVSSSEWDSGAGVEAFLRVANSLKGLPADPDRVRPMVEAFIPSRNDTTVRGQDRNYIVEALGLETDDPAPVIQAPLLVWRHPSSDVLKVWPREIVVPTGTHVWLTAVNQSKWLGGKPKQVTATLAYIGPRHASARDLAPETLGETTNVALPRILNLLRRRAVWLHQRNFREPGDRTLEVFGDSGREAARLKIRVLSAADYAADPAPVPSFDEGLRDLLDWPDI